MNIGLLVYPGCVVSGLFAFSELLEVANRRANQSYFSFTWIGVDDKDVAITTGNNRVTTLCKVEASILESNVDAILIPGFWTSRQEHVVQAMESYQALIEALAQLPKKTPVWGYCTAVSLMAAANRLDKKQATATWWLSDFLQNQFPEVQWRFSQTHIAGIQNQTASGLNGYLPIAQSLIETKYGEGVLRDIADLMILPKPDESARPFIQIKLMDLDDKLLRQVYIWVEKTPATKLAIADLAKQVNQTERTLARKVKLATELSVASFMRLIKLNQASDLLIYSRKPINWISDSLGFSDDAAFRRMFKKISSYTPTEYRQKFQR